MVRRDGKALDPGREGTPHPTDPGGSKSVLVARRPGLRPTSPLSTCVCARTHTHRDARSARAYSCMLQAAVSLDMVKPLTQDALLQVWVCLKEPNLPTACSEVEPAQPEAGDSGGVSWPPAACYVFLDSARNCAPCAHHCAPVYASQSYKYPWPYYRDSDNYPQV